MTYFMAVMGRRKRAVAQGWNAINKQRDEETKRKEEEFKEKHGKEVSFDEHEERVKKLKEIGLIK